MESLVMCVKISRLFGRVSQEYTTAFINEVRSDRRRRKKWFAPDPYNGRKIMNVEEANKFIAAAIRAGKPFMAGRYGNVELNAMWHVREDNKGFIAPVGKAFYALQNNAGFFPNDKKLMIKFAEIMRWATSQVDLMAIWIMFMEQYELSKYGNNPNYCWLPGVEPYHSKEGNWWSAALEDKKVLVITPFAKSTEQQYQKRELLFPGTNILPKFKKLIVHKAVQTIAFNRDDRFNNWFEALDYMYNEAMKEDFDVAIIGCGAYGFPLAAKIKAAGKISIHMGGAVQILFGIRNKRWDGSAMTSNPAWVRPSAEETPKNAKNVENACYW